LTMPQTYTYAIRNLASLAVPNFQAMCEADNQRFLLVFTCGGGGPFLFRPVGVPGLLTLAPIVVNDHEHKVLKWRDYGALLGYAWEGAAAIGGGGITATWGVCRAG